MKVEDLMMVGVLSVREQDEIALAAQMMLWSGVRHLAVVRGEGEVVGVISERDVLAHRARVGSRDGDRYPVALAMQSPAEVVDAGEDVLAAAQRMGDRKIGCLPVMSRGKLVGMLTTTELLRHQTEVASALAPQRTPGTAIPVARVMRRDPPTVEPDDYLLDAAGRMVELQVLHLPVVDGEGHVIGMLSDRDVRNAIGDPLRVLEEERFRMDVETFRVSNVMSVPAVTVTPETSLSAAAARLVDRRVGALPVVDDEGRLVGIVSTVDVLRVVASGEEAAAAGAHAAQLSDADAEAEVAAHPT